MILHLPMQALARDDWDLALPTQFGGTIDAAATLLARTRPAHAGGPRGLVALAVDTEAQSLIATVGRIVDPGRPARPEAVYAVTSMAVAHALYTLHQTARALGVASL